MFFRSEMFFKTGFKKVSSNCLEETKNLEIDGCPSKEKSIWIAYVINECYVYCFSLR